jgi:hypothetical protein
LGAELLQLHSTRLLWVIIMEYYPGNYPLPDKDSYSGLVQQGIVRTAGDVPAPNQILVFSRERTDLTMQFTMVNNMYEVWLEWVYTYGFNYFWMNVISEYNPVNPIFSEHRVRFTTDIQYVKRGDNWLTVSIGAEILQGDTEDFLAPSNRVYDFILGGSPSSPSVDTVHAGTPSSPSTDIIIGHLYAYTLE